MIDIEIEDDAWVAAAPQAQDLVQAAAAAALRQAEFDGDAVTILLTDDDSVRDLNARFRGKDYATNVLTFPYDTEPTVCGDIVICAPVVAREAAEQGKPLAAHYAHLVMHGVLHLLGHDHETSDADAETMEAHERRLLAGFGLPDPYASAAGTPGAR